MIPARQTPARRKSLANASGLSLGMPRSAALRDMVRCTCELQGQELAGQDGEDVNTVRLAHQNQFCVGDIDDGVADAVRDLFKLMVCHFF